MVEGSGSGRPSRGRGARCAGPFRRLTFGAHHYRNEKTTMNANAEYLRRIGYHKVGRLLVGVTMMRISYGNRQRDDQGIYWRLAFLPFETLMLELSPG